MTIQIPLKVKTRYDHGEVPDPSEVTIGELLINSADGTLWTKKNDGTIHNIVTAGAMAPHIYDPNNIEEDVYDRSNHTGHQSADTIHDFASAASAAAPVQSVQGRGGNVTITKSDVGLGDVNNTSDANKPVSTQQSSFVVDKITEHENSPDPHPQYREATEAVEERVDSLESDLEDISDLTTLLSEKVDLSYVDAAFPTVVDNILASVDDLPVIDGSSISKIFVVDGIAYTLGVDIDDSSGDAQYIQSWKAKAKVKSGQLIKNLADGLFYKFEASSWIQSAAPDTMAYISDTSGKIFTDPIIIDDLEDLSDLDHLITPGFYVLNDAGYYTGSQITVVVLPTPGPGTMYSQILYSPIAGRTLLRYRFDVDGEPPGEWTTAQSSITQSDIDLWSGTYTYEQPNAVLTYDYDLGKYTLKKSGVALVPEAPNDGKQYARKDGDWAEVTSGGAAASVMADITDKQGKVLDDLIHLPSDTDLDGLTTKGGYFLDADGLSLHQGSIVWVGETTHPVYGQIIVQSLQSLVAAKVMTRYQVVAMSAWQPWKILLSADDVSEWYFGTTSSAPNAVINSDGSFGRSLASLVTEAPSDGKQYTRKDGDWAEVSAGGGGSVSWGSVTDKPAVIGAGATVSEARDALGIYISPTPPPLPFEGQLWIKA